MYQKKSLGQNFLKSKQVIDDIVRAGNIAAGETVLEAGPGEGVLTETLLATGAKVIAVEKDHRLIPILQQKFSNETSSGQLTLFEADILNFDLCSMFPARTERIPVRSGGHVPCYKVIANIPYYITGMFIRKFLESENQPSVMVILVQKEVAERIVASDKKESILSISVKAYGTPHYIKTVKAGNFSPAPNVDSAVLAIENISKNRLAGIDEKRFFEILKAGFAHKRKIISGNLKSVWGNHTEEKISRCGIGMRTRAEELTFENWLCLSKK